MKSRYGLPTQAVTFVKRSRYLHRAARRARLLIGRFLPPRSFPGIPGRVHFNDFMLTEVSADEIASYRERAFNVISHIEASLDAAGKTFDDVATWLDFGCGYGRVLRFLVGRVPAERIYASDVVREGVEFCRSEFGVRPLYSQADLRTLQLGQFDFIYAISVLTHLNQQNSIALLHLFGESLTPGGIVLFTAHGRHSLENPELYGAKYADRRDEIARHVTQTGIAFLPYPFLSTEDYGMAWHSAEWIETKMKELHGGRLHLLMFEAQGLDDHQDVFAFQREGLTAAHALDRRGDS